MSVQETRQEVIDVAKSAPPETLELAAAHFNLLGWLRDEREWSLGTFGPGSRTTSIIEHIRRKLKEIEAAPADLVEWIDVIILALDGAWRAGWGMESIGPGEHFYGFSPEQVIVALIVKQLENLNRRWPDWRTAHPNAPIEHIREEVAEFVERCGKCSNTRGYCECAFPAWRPDVVSPARPYAAKAIEIGELVEAKNAAYGGAFAKSADFLRLLYPEGIRPEQYGDVLLLARIFDKQMRIANRPLDSGKDALGESPYQDIAGYGILGAVSQETRKER